MSSGLLVAGRGQRDLRPRRWVSPLWRGRGGFGCGRQTGQRVGLHKFNLAEQRVLLQSLLVDGSGAGNGGVERGRRCFKMLRWVGVGVLKGGVMGVKGNG